MQSSILKSLLGKSRLLTQTPSKGFKFIQKHLPAKYEPYYRLG